MLAVYLFSKGSKNISSEIVSPLTGLMLPNCVPVLANGSGSGGKPVVFNCGSAGIPKLLNGLVISGTSEDKISIDVIEDKNHPFYIGCQFHPEFLSTLEKPAPLFVEFIKKCITPLKDIFYPSISSSIC